MKLNSAGGIILFSCVIVSLIIANSPLGAVFQQILDYPIGFSTSYIDLEYSVLMWINDGLMTIFFLMVGLEIKRELIDGELSSYKKATLPLVAALGGILVPALIYSALNSGSSTAGGWGIPMATDIAFALAIIMMLGNKVPLSLKIFLVALAVIDDLCAIVVIAIFYTSELHLNYLAYAGGIVLLLSVFNKLGVRNLFCYLIPGAVMWYFIHHSGIHATIAGVLTAFAIPTLNSTIAKGDGKEHESPLEKLEHLLVKPVNFFIMPLFALANTNILFETRMIDGIFSTLGMGIILGLLIGKPVGIVLFSWVAVKLKICQLPKGTNWQHIIGVGALAGIGFTMSIFITLLSFKDASILSQAKFFILTGSLIAGLTGYLLLSRQSKKG